MNGYIAHWSGRRIEIRAATLYDAKKRAAELLRVPAKQQHMIAVLLAEKDGAPVTHNPAIL